MDPITHTLTGVIAAHAFFRRRIGPETVLILAVATNLPDIDAIVHLTGERTAVMARRTLGHSIFLLPLWSALAAILWRWKFPHLHWRTLWGLNICGCLLHVFFDLVNSFGVVLLWPFSFWRPELGIIFILDPVLTALLVLPLLLALKKTGKVRLQTFARLCAAAVTVYVLACTAAKLQAKKLLAIHSSQKGLAASFHYVFPEPLGLHRWHGVALAGNEYRNYLIYPLSGKVEETAVVATELEKPEVRVARASLVGRRMDWFFKAPVWQVVSPAMNGKPAEVVCYDLRFRSQLIQRAHYPFLFRFYVSPEGVTLDRTAIWPYVEHFKKSI